MTKHQKLILNGLKNGDHIVKRFRRYTYHNSRLKEYTVKALISTGELYRIETKNQFSINRSVYYFVHKSHRPLPPWTIYEGRRITDVKRL